MGNNELSARADAIEKKIKLLMKAMTGIAVSLAADLVSLVVFAAVCAGTGMRETNPEGLLTGCIVLMLIAVTLVICFVSLLVAAKISAKILTKLDSRINGEGADGK